jgi:hypothetical protein
MTARATLPGPGAGVIALLLLASLPISPEPASGQGRGGRGQAATMPEAPVVTPVPGFRALSGPGPLFEGVIMDLPAGDDLPHYGYVMEEYFVSGTAQGAPYTTRVLVRRPSDWSRASGVVVAEGMHPSGNSWMFHFTHAYVMSEGHVGVEIATTGLEHLAAFNAGRYAALEVQGSQANDILAQVGAWLRSDASPLAGPPLDRMILMGTSASAGIVLRYLPAHEVYRRPDMGPIYDGFLPTSNISTIPPVDVPVIQIPTMTEAESLAPDAERRPDGDAPGDQFRIYEFAGMSHNDSRSNATYSPDPCMFPVSRFPLGGFMAVGLDHLIRWAAGTPPPRGEKLRLDHDETDGSTLALDEFGNATGGIRNTYVDLPRVRYGVRNRGAEPPIANPSRMIAARPAGTANQLCALAGYEIPLPAEALESLYEDASDYRAKVSTRLDELTEAGWFLPVYRDLVLQDAEAARIPE